MQNLINNSFKMRHVEPVERLGKIYDIEMLHPHAYNGYFCVNNGILVFKYQSENYVTPYSSEKIDTLKQHGFKERSMYVPFSDRDIPVERLDEYNAIFNKIV